MNNLLKFINSPRFAILPLRGNRDC